MATTTGGASASTSTQSDVNATSSVAASPEPTTKPKAPPPDDDEIEWNGRKAKRSELFDTHARVKEHTRAANARFEEAARLRKENEAAEARKAEEAESFKKDPWAWFEKHGIDPDQAAEERLTRQLQRGRMTPEQIEAEKIKAENAELKKRFESLETEKKTEEGKRRAAHFKQHFDKAIGAALQAGTPLPHTPEGVNEVAAVMISYLEAGHQVDPRFAAEKAYERFTANTTLLCTQIAKNGDAVQTGPKIAEAIGPEAVDALMRWKMAEAQGLSKAPAAPPKIVPQQQTKGPETFEEVRKRLKLGA